MESTHTFPGCGSASQSHALPFAGDLDNISNVITATRSHAHQALNQQTSFSFGNPGARARPSPLNMIATKLDSLRSYQEAEETLTVAEKEVEKFLRSVRTASLNLKMMKEGAEMNLNQVITESVQKQAEVTANACKKIKRS